MDVFVELRAVITDFQRKMGEARGEMTATKEVGSSTFSKLGSAAQTGVLAVAAGALTVAAVSTRMASDFQAAMELIHTQAGGSQAEVNNMSKAVLNLAGPTATAPMALADALYHVESTGLHGAAALGVLTAAAKGAKIGHADLTDTTTALTAAVASGIGGAQNYQQAMGALNATVGAGDMKMQDLNEAMGTGITVVAKQFGLSLNDVGAALATFGDNNIRGAQAGTELRMSVMDLTKQSKPGQEALAKIGIKAGELGADMRRGGLGAALQDLHNHLDAAGVKGAEVGSVLTDAFTKKSAAPLAILLDQLGRFDQKQKDVAGGAKNFGADWQATTKTFQFQTDELKAHLSTLGVQIGTKLIPIIEHLARTVSAVIGWFQKHKAAAKELELTLVVAFGLIAAAATAAFIAENAATLGIIAGLLALAAAGVYLATHWHQVWGDIKRWFDDAVRFLRSGFGTLLVLILGPMAPLALLALHWQQVWNGIKTVLGTVVSNVLTWFRRLGDGFFAVIQGILGAASHLPFIGHYFAAANQAVRAAHADFDATLSSWAGDAAAFGSTIGQNLGYGTAAGIRAALPAVLAASNLIVSQAVAAMHKGAQAASPSRLTMALGKDLMDGLVLGMTGARPGVVSAAGLMANRAATGGGTLGLPAPAPAPGAGGGGDLVVQINGQTFARITGPDLRTWLNTRTARNATKVIAT